MAITATTERVPRGDVIAPLNFFSPPADGAVPFNYVDTPPAGEPQRNFSDATHDVVIEDIRGREAEFASSPESLDKNAFLVVQNQPPSAETEWLDDESIRKNYYPEVEALLLKNVPGSTRVVFFDHTIRRPQKAEAASGPTRGPVLRVHIDQTAKAAADRVRRHLPADEAEKLLQGRFRIINVWRPLNKGPVESSPLAFASSASVRDEDVITVEHRYPKERNFIGQTAGIQYHPDQKWHYLSGMTGDERLLLECFDSEALRPGNTTVQGGRLAHTAFSDSRALPDAEPRESIEVRTLVFGP
ncbi:uncharacterized protein SPSK_01880 [Sporothrix schenckii 1099-18]|uniref:Methyltransferase n=2 Tax=Sporothrix schenckii TaxID=29908 RepID=U7PHK8_SPOS1|nr:uncharacterized protein SPSK_01880 [Sporothrix schenckii 1099-18]ERS95068.1 hypothetical protein HMPREF1624_08557 [Sporothrix schenckii ATCC 58251]KJR87318.1 hypothetical protein SPSK_01880 [Sporothrix schenckii 1099-18]